MDAEFRAISQTKDSQQISSKICPASCDIWKFHRPAEICFPVCLRQVELRNPTSLARISACTMSIPKNELQSTIRSIPSQQYSSLDSDNFHSTDRNESVHSLHDAILSSGITDETKSKIQSTGPANKSSVSGNVQSPHTWVTNSLSGIKPADFFNEE